MKILIIGATGKTGRRVLSLSLMEGHIVTAFVRNAEKLREQFSEEALSAKAG